MGWHLSPRYGQVMLVSGYPVLTAVRWSQHWCAICVQYHFSRTPKLARKCEIEHWLPCGAEGQAGWRCTVTWLPNFLGWVDLLTHGALQARFARQNSAIKLWGFELSPWSNKISAQNFKHYMTSMDRKMSPRSTQVMIVSVYSSLTAVD